MVEEQWKGRQEGVGRGDRKEWEGETGRSGKGRQEGVGRGDRKEREGGKVEGSPKHSIYPLLPNIQTAQLPLKISSSFPPLPSSLPSKLSYLSF